MCLPPLLVQSGPQKNNNTKILIELFPVLFCFWTTETWYTYTLIFSMLRFRGAKTDIQYIISQSEA